MYGLINQALKELVASHSGVRVWNEICALAGIDSEDFDSLLPYNDSVTYTLVRITSERLGIPSTEILRMFGLHWVQFTVRHGYGEIMNLFGRDLKTSLKNLNRMHGHMGAMMPDLHPPRFIVDEVAPEELTLHYYSSRQGLAPLVIGILEGLAEKYHEHILIRHLPKNTRSDHDEFDIVFVST